MAQLKSTVVQGALTATGNVVANKLIKIGGTSDQILMADGSTSTIGGLITIPNISVSDTTSASTHPFVGDITASGHTITVTRKSLADVGLSTVYRYKGTKTWSQLLAITSAAIGDVYNISDEDPNGVTGADWACYKAVSAATTASTYGTYWQSIGGIVDLSAYLTEEADTLQSVTDRGASTTKAVTVAGVTSNDAVIIKGSGGHREGIRLLPEGNLSSIWWNTSGTRDYTTGQMWGITVYTPSYSDTTKRNTFRFRGPASSTATAATDQMWINTEGLVTSRGGFAKSGSSDSYVLLAGGGVKALTDFQASGNFVTLDTTQTITGAKTFSGGIAITKATENKKMQYYLGIDAFANGGAVKWIDKTDMKVGYADDADKLDGQHGSYYLDYNNFTNTPTIPTVPAVNNGKLTIQRNGTTVATFTANQSGNTTANITDNDTKNTAGSTNSNSKLFLIGATSQAANPQTYSDSEVYTTNGTLTTAKVQVGGGTSTLQYNTTEGCLEFIFA